MVVWMKVTKDKYELPVAVADSAVELAGIVNTTANSISSSICHGCGTYVKVVIDDEESERTGFDGKHEKGGITQG